MKKTLVLISLLAIFLLALAACGNSNGNEPANTATPRPANTATPTPAPAATFDTSRVIAVFTREDGSGTRDAFVSITGVGDDMYVEAVVENSTAGIRTNVMNNSFAIGYISVGSMNDTVKALSVDGVLPSDDTIRSGAYGLQRPFTIVYNVDNAINELAQDFIAFMLSSQGQEIAATNWTMVDVNAPTYTTRGLTGTLRVGGSTSVEPLMQRMKEAYEVLNPGVNIEISSGGSGTGINEATSGVIDIGMSSRLLRETEKAALTDIDIALDGVAVIVNTANPLTNITIDQIKAIFTGEVTRWNGIN
ncbi:MAG: extracellular solute-binding protein [Defluviitaleaceae bacterium]|nr:extracellular solute-binding protein [Defluviitaleaceae bacterium]MCL2604130.1 extracellular solute-binding protein [Defluviitaleaceae bacterium]